MSPLLPPSPLWGEGEGEGKYQIFFVRLLFDYWCLELDISKLISKFPQKVFSPGNPVFFFNPLGRETINHPEDSSAKF
jgi:hypothetical protein